MAITIKVDLANDTMRKDGLDPDDSIRGVITSLQVQTLHKILDDIDISPLGMSKTKCKKATQYSTRWYGDANARAIAEDQFNLIVDHIKDTLTLGQLVNYLVWQGNIGHYLKVEDI